MPIIMLTAKGQEADIVLRLNLGADDYVTKPFSIRGAAGAGQCLPARQHNRSRRTVSLRRLRAGPRRAQAVPRRAGGRRSPPRSSACWPTWSARQGRALTRDDILDAVWGHSVMVTPRSVDRCVTTLRAKIEPDPHAPPSSRPSATSATASNQGWQKRAAGCDIAVVIYHAK